MDDATPSGGRSTQAERRQRTRDALVEAAVSMSASGESFDAISMRKVTSQANVAPSAFYRYFASMDDLGLTIIGEASLKMQVLLADMPFTGRRPASDSLTHVIVANLLALVRHDHHYLAFLAQQRAGGNEVLRSAARAELRELSSQIAVRLGRVPAYDHWPPGDLTMLANLILTVLMSTVDAALERMSRNRSANKDSQSLARIGADAERQLRLLLIGARNWRAGDAATNRRTVDRPTPEARA